MSVDPETTRIVRSWLDEGVTELPDRVLDAVLDELPATPQRRGRGWLARRTPIMSKIVPIGVAAAAVVVAAVLGFQLLGSPDGGVGADPSVDETPDATLDPTPSPTSWIGQPVGPYVLTQEDDPVQVTVEIASPGWQARAQFDGVDKDDDGLDAPETVGGILVAWGWPAGTEFDVYGDPCQWSTTIPDTPATTPDDIAAALAAQAQTEASDPRDVTVGGYEGKSITLQVPMSYESPGATREEEFSACDRATYGFYGTSGKPEPERYAQGPGQIDELWIIDVEGAIVILDAAYSPATPSEVVDQMRAMVESATFELP